MFEKDLLAGKRILVTGGGSGLGAAMGRRFVELGAELIICGRRLELLEAEKAYTRQGDALAERRQALPWVKVEKDYLFQTEQGDASLAEAL